MHIFIFAYWFQIYSRKKMSDLWIQIKFSSPPSLFLACRCLWLVNKKRGSKNFLRVHGTERQESIKLLCSAQTDVFMCFWIEKVFPQNTKIWQRKFLLSYGRAQGRKTERNPIFFFCENYSIFWRNGPRGTMTEKNVYLVTRWMNFHWYSAENFSTFNL